MSNLVDDSPALSRLEEIYAELRSTLCELEGLLGRLDPTRRGYDELLSLRDECFRMMRGGEGLFRREVTGEAWQTRIHAPGTLFVVPDTLMSASQEHDTTAAEARRVARACGSLYDRLLGAPRIPRADDKAVLDTVRGLAETAGRLSEAHELRARELEQFSRMVRETDDQLIGALEDVSFGPERSSAEAGKHVPPADARPDGPASGGTSPTQAPPVSQGPTCPVCGKSLVPNVPICPYCGSAFQQAASAPSSYSSAPPSAGASSRPSPVGGARDAAAYQRAASAPPDQSSLSSPGHASSRPSFVGSIIGGARDVASHARDRLTARRKKREDKKGQESSPVQSTIEASSSEAVRQGEQPAPATLSDVRFVGVAPAELVRASYATVDIVMHEEGWEQAVDQVKDEHDEPVKTADGGWLQIARQTTVRVELSSPELGLLGSEQGVWGGRYLRLSFVFMVPADLTARQVLLQAHVYFDGVPATHLRFIVSVTNSDVPTSFRRRVVPERSDVREAFVSYASQDRTRVATIIQGMRVARPDLDIFFDVETLRSGEDWRQALCRRIETSDVLFLCWSRSASESEWVDFEWRYALSEKGIECIEPVAIEPPNVCPPPQELSSKHFNDPLLYIIDAR